MDVLLQNNSANALTESSLVNFVWNRYADVIGICPCKAL